MIQRMELGQRDFKATTVDTFKNSQENRNTMRTKKKGDCKVRNENLAGWTKSRLDLLWKKQTRARADRPAEMSQTEAQRTVGDEARVAGGRSSSGRGDGARATRGEHKKASDTATGVPGPGGQGSVVKRQWLQFPRPNLKYQPTEQRSSRTPKQGKHKGSHTKIH